jgi:hypothetical protein
MKLPNTISLPREVKSFAFSAAFKTKQQRQDYIRMMVELEYQKASTNRIRNRLDRATQGESDSD